MPGEAIPAGARPTLVFSSDDLPANLGERQRRHLWRERYSELYGPMDAVYADDRRFSARLEVTRIGGVELATVVSTVERFVRTPRSVAVARSDHLGLVINRGRARMQVQQKGRETPIDPRATALVCNASPGSVACQAGNPWLFVQMPRTRLRDLVRDADDLVARPLPSDVPAFRHLNRYLDLVLPPDGVEEEAALIDHVETTILDLAALVLGAKGDHAELARLRGLRAARLRMVLAAIHAGYDDPGFSVRTLAARVGLSPRYVQDLLQETGTSVTERVLERRLQKARAVLADPRAAGRKVIDIALACGFSEISYFNRAFRRRFGVPPSAIRSTRGVDHADSTARSGELDLRGLKF